MNTSLCRAVHREICSSVRCVTTHAATPPQASQEQIFRGSGLSRAGTSVGTEDDWQAALLARERLQTQEVQADAEEGPDDASRFASNRIGQVSLPPPMIDSVNALLGDTHKAAVRTTALRFYESLKLKNEGRTNDVPMPPSKLFTGLEADAYIAGLMPQLYASVFTVLSELRKRLGRDWTPGTVLDCGLGPGTAAAAFREVFVTTNPHPAAIPPHMTIVQVNVEMKARTVSMWASGEGTDKHPNADTDIYPKLGSTDHKYDVILAPHVLGDVKGRPTERDHLVRDLWSRLNDGGVMLLLERGNPLGFEQIARARQDLLRPTQRQRVGRSQGPTSAAHVIAPCPHDGTCPMYVHGHQPNRRQWCHFSQRLQRPDFLQRTKHAKENIEDVGYSYILIRKGVTRPKRPTSPEPGPSSATTDKTLTGTGETRDREVVRASYHWPRIVLPPLKRHKHVLLDVCAARADRPMSDTDRQRDGEGEGEQMDEKSDAIATEGGQIQRVTIPKSFGPQAYRFARKSHWGDLLPFDGKTVIEKPELDRPSVSPRGRGGADRARRARTDRREASSMHRGGDD